MVKKKKLEFITLMSSPCPWQKLLLLRLQLVLPTILFSAKNCIRTMTLSMQEKKATQITAQEEQSH